MSDQAAAAFVGTSRPAPPPSPDSAALLPVIKDDSLCRPSIIGAQPDGDGRAVIELEADFLTLIDHHPGHALPDALTDLVAVPWLSPLPSQLSDAHSGAVERLTHDWERLVTFYQFPREHWRHLRTTNIVESPFAAVRLRTTAAKRFKKVDSATAMIWKVLQIAENTFRRLNSPKLLLGV